MKNKIIGVIALILGIIATVLTIRFEFSVWGYTRLYIIIHRFKEWSFIVLLWVLFMYFTLKWIFDCDHDKNHHK